METRMKIFSLETQKYVAWWSAVWGVVIFFLVSIFSETPSVCTDLPCTHIVGYPWSYETKTFSFYYGKEVQTNRLMIGSLILDLFFWIITVYIILIIIRYSKSKQHKVSAQAK